MSRAAVLLAMILGGCVIARPVRFDDGRDWHYRIQDQAHPEASLVSVIDDATHRAHYDFRSVATGAGNRWLTYYGEMLEDVADVELPQLVGRYRRTSSMPAAGSSTFTMRLSVPSYAFRDFHAELTVLAELYGDEHQLLFSRSYRGVGSYERGKMVGAGAFGQKSAVRQSSLRAFRDAFAQLRRDLGAALDGRPPT